TARIHIHTQNDPRARGFDLNDDDPGLIGESPEVARRVDRARSIRPLYGRTSLPNNHTLRLGWPTDGATLAVPTGPKRSTPA
ncbi:MAG: hypothetical protein RJB04_1149, partial [Verrucomicrobiota bacterium]